MVSFDEVSYSIDQPAIGEEQVRDLGKKRGHKEADILICSSAFPDPHLPHPLLTLTSYSLHNRTASLCLLHVCATSYTCASAQPHCLPLLAAYLYHISRLCVAAQPHRLRQISLTARVITITRPHCHTAWPLKPHCVRQHDHTTMLPHCLRLAVGGCACRWCMAQTSAASLVQLHAWAEE
eukprot:1114302-Pelagomonas_calceolata.AAC.2